jgi:outer membrane lipoprotein-sorting protein
MKKNVKTLMVTLFPLFFLLTCVYTADAARYLKTVEAKDQEVTGTFTLILYGGRHSNDLETIVFLIRKGTSMSLNLMHLNMIIR